MRLLHTADWHLGYRQYGMAVRESDFVRPLAEIGDVAENERVDAVLVAGDVFDSPRPPASAVQAAREFGDRMKAAGIPVLAVDGNHDLAGGRWARLCGFDPLYDESRPKVVEAGGTRVAGIDFCRTQQLLDRLESYKAAGVDLRGGVLALHAEIAELTVYAAPVGIEQLEPYMDALNVGYVALGHIHNAVGTASTVGRPYRYPGSTEVNDVSELGPRSVDVVSVGDGGWTCESRVLKTRRFEVMDVDSDEAVDARLVTMTSDPEAFWLVKVNLSAYGRLVERVEEAMQGRLYRMMPYGSRAIEEQSGRAEVVVGLKDAIGRFFSPGSDEASLVGRIIDAPSQARQIAQEYVDKKEEVR